MPDIAIRPTPTPPHSSKALPRVDPIDLIRIVVVLVHRPHRSIRLRGSCSHSTPSSPHFLKSIVVLPTGLDLFEPRQVLVFFECFFGVDGGRVRAAIRVGVRGLRMRGLAANAFHEGLGLRGVLALLADLCAIFVEEEGEGEAGES